MDTLRGISRISVGKLTHVVRAVGLSLRVPAPLTAAARGPGRGLDAQREPCHASTMASGVGPSRAGLRQPKASFDAPRSAH